MTLLDKKFSTKTGYCHILPDKVVLTRDGVIGDLAQLTVGNNIARPLVIYALIVIGLIFMGISSWQKDQLEPTIFSGVLAVFLLVGILTSLNNSATPVIERSSIQSVEFKKGIPGLTRARFVVWFTDEKGKRKKRLIFLPGTLSGGVGGAAVALEIMKEEGLI